MFGATGLGVDEPDGAAPASFLALKFLSQMHGLFLRLEIISKVRVELEVQRLAYMQGPVRFGTAKATPHFDT